MPINRISVEQLCHSLRANDADVTSVVMGPGPLAEAQMDAVTSALQGNTCIQSLVFVKVFQTEPGIVRTFATSVLPAHRSIQELALTSNGLTAVHASWFGGALKVNTYLTCLNLNSNCVGDDGVTGLVGGLQKNKALKKLYLGNNKITDKGAKTLAEQVVGQNTALEELHLNNNEITGTCGQVAACFD